MFIQQIYIYRDSFSPIEVILAVFALISNVPCLLAWQRFHISSNDKWAIDTILVDAAAGQMIFE